jgi:hypothetical protein
MRFLTGMCLLAVLLLLPALPAVAANKDPAPLLARIKAVRKQGAGNAEAAAAWMELVKIGPSALLPTLAAMDADPITANWLRAAADAIAEKALAARQLSAKDLETFVLQKKHNGAARRIAYEWLVRLDPTAPGRLLPGMLDDPGAELRRDAVAVVLKEADALRPKDDKAAAIAAYRKALAAARDEDQVEAAAKQLKALGVTADLAHHYGFVRRWLLLEPFDNHNSVGFATVYPPETGVEPSKTYKGKGGADTRWTAHTTTDPHGVVDLNKVLGKHKGVVVYAYAVVESPKEQKVQLRAGSMNAIKIFLNGKLLFGREEYHHGMQLDQHIGKGVLKAGRNIILVKLCQNEQTDSWAQEWKFQLRLCDDLGTALPVKVVTPDLDKRRGRSHTRPACELKKPTREPRVATRRKEKGKGGQ